METLIKYKNNKRVWELDFLRGLSVLLMIFDHIMFDFASLHGWFSNFLTVNNSYIDMMWKFANWYFELPIRTVLHYVFIFVFLMLTGISCAFSKSNPLRGAKLMLVAGTVTAVTLIIQNIVMYDIGIIWGILHCISFALLSLSAIENIGGLIKVYIPQKFTQYKILTQIFNLNNFMLLLGSIIMIYGAYIKWYDIEFLKNFDTSILAQMMFGLAKYGGDSFGFIPYTGMVYIGFATGRIMYKQRVSLLPKLDGKWNRPFLFAGRHALFIYIAHQLLAMGAIAGICLLLGYRF